MNKEVVLSVNNLVKTYGKSRGVNGISFNVYKGEIFGLIGPNGAGKSTTIKSILGIVRKTSGTIKVLGTDSENEKEIKKHIGYLPSECNFYNNMKVKDLLEYSKQLYGNKDISIEKYASRLNLDLNKKIEDLSYGNRKKVGIIDAIISDGELLILDEATGGLDPLVQEEFFKILEELKGCGKTIIYSAHILTEVQRLCDRVAIIKQGNLIKIEDIKNINNIKLKEVIVYCAEDNLKDLQDVYDYKRENSKVTFKYCGDINKLCKALSSLNVVDINIGEPSLEEIFLKYYEEDK
ncbi:MAG: ABC transporter ATP-binding protein [Clostridiaceae bacterium]|nr:ABC transporter ATP-binding protein [Clostridiaceae bacterium]